MVQFLIRRFLLLIPTLFAVSIVTFAIIQLPAGDYVTAYTANLATSGETLDQQQLDALRERFAFDQPVYVQYYKWMSNILLRGDFGQSFEWNRPVDELIWARFRLTIPILLLTMVFTWLLAFPIGIYSAVKQYSMGTTSRPFSALSGWPCPIFAGAGFDVHRL
jgi:peptide/nickel transport system permease protein